MTRCVLVCVGLALGLVGTAVAETAQPYATWIKRSYIPAPPGQIVVSHEPCGEAVGCTDGATIYLDHDYSLYGRSVFFHELGHVFDDRVMTDAARTRFAAIFHRSDSETWPMSGEDGDLSEWFAEGYRLCAMYRSFRDPVLAHVDGESYAYEPTADQQRRVCSLIRSERKRAASEETAQLR